MVSRAAFLATALLQLGEAVRVVKKKSKQNSTASEYDCNGDGVQDCKSWTGEFATGQCSYQPKCTFSYRWWDSDRESSCRCHQCAAQSPNTAASKAPYDSEVGKSFYAWWRPWNKLAQTCATWMAPKSDEDLAAILRYAKSNGYTVRPTGATHSAGGIVTEWDNAQNVMTVSLAEYQAPGEWEYTLKEKSKGAATVMVNAGWSPMQLYAEIRPKDYFLPTQTAGPVFALGGLVANCVHGGNYARGFLHEYVVRMRVMLHDGTIQVIDKESELRFWRNSYGLLGFILGLEFKLDYRPNFQTFFKQEKVNWNEEDFWTWLKQEAHVDISQEEAPAGQPGDRTALMGQFFFNPYEAGENGRASISAVMWKANENATDAGVADSAPANAEGNYRNGMAAEIVDEVLGGSTPFNDAIKHWGGPKVLPIGFDMNDLLAGNARMMTKLSMSGPNLLLASNRASYNDGFYAYNVPNVVYGAYFVKPKDIFKAWNVLVDNFMARRNSSEFVWNGPPELRFLTVADDAVLNPVPAGMYAVSEYLAFPVPGKSDQGWKKAFKEVQDKWGDEFGGKPHIGKFWGFGTAADGTVQPYQAERACKIYSDAQKDTFNAYRHQMDPEGLFAGGDAMKLLAKC